MAAGPLVKLKRFMSSRSAGGDPRSPTPAIFTAPTLTTARASQDATPERQAAHFPPERHATELLNFLLEEVGAGADLLYPEVQDLYWQMCARINWAPRPWNPVGRELRKLLGKRKTYSWFDGVNGEQRRLRVYRLTAPAPDHRQTSRTRSLSA
jgi:hypothetical protein